MIWFVVVLVSFLVLAGTGYYLLFRQRNPVNLPPVPPKWLDKVSPSARAIHLKEMNKQTAKRWTKAWFMEYWRGQRSAFYAWFTWYFITGILLGITSMVLILILNSILSLSHFFLFLNTLIVVIFIYKTLALFIWWRCAKNSRQWTQYLIRVFIILAVLGTVYNTFFVEKTTKSDHLLAAHVMA